VGVPADDGRFVEFVARVEPGLRRALAGHLPMGAVPDAVAEAFAYAWEHWDRVAVLDNPAGYLFRVAQSRSRSRRHGHLPLPAVVGDVSVEPGLVQAMRSLPSRQRSAVWLVHACGWSYAEAAEALAVSTSSIGTHVARGLAQLRSRMGVATND
jgi:RNA polymerase sigma-70 factor (ECF subfamily)